MAVVGTLVVGWGACGVVAAGRVLVGAGWVLGAAGRVFGVAGQVLVDADGAGVGCPGGPPGELLRELLGAVGAVAAAVGVGRGRVGMGVGVGVRTGA